MARSGGIGNFGHYLAGLIDGEGCFVIAKRGRNNPRHCYQCCFQLKLREDDRDLIHEIHRTVGIGNVSRERRRHDTDCIMWSVDSKADCLVLVRLLRRYPLRGKKARDFDTWAQAVEAWATLTSRGGIRSPEAEAVWVRIGSLKTELAEGRRYVVAE